VTRVAVTVAVKPAANKEPVRVRPFLNLKNGGAEGARTPDLNTASVALSQLSYGPTGTVQRIVSGDRERGQHG
jgi:hypothetical protein